MRVQDYDRPARRTAPPRSFSGSFRLFEVFGITVFLHWSWFLVAAWELQGGGFYGNLPPLWRISIYLSLFLIVLIHEFGHALACRSVGGRAERIVLWPLGGVAFVAPPQRPGAMLWSIAAGPLVNVLLLPVFFMGTFVLGPQLQPEAAAFVHALFTLNLILLVFNMLPIYPLDGGQILRSLLWFFVGAALSLQIATVIGIIGAVAAILYAVKTGDTWLVVLALFGAFRCWTGFQEARMLRRIEQIPRNTGFACPHCGAVPPAGKFWQCQCGTAFDLFASNFVCPRCGASHPAAQCGACGQTSTGQSWMGHPHPQGTPVPLPPTTTPMP